eukprot:SAG31_NODE_2898_length_4934_cov_2.220430_2_plen_999_part_00
MVAQRKMLHIECVKNLRAELKASMDQRGGVPLLLLEQFGRHLEKIKSIDAQRFNNDDFYKAILGISLDLKGCLQRVCEAFITAAKLPEVAHTTSGCRLSLACSQVVASRWRPLDAYHDAQSLDACLHWMCEKVVDLVMLGEQVPLQLEGSEVKLPPAQKWVNELGTCPKRQRSLAEAILETQRRAQSVNDAAVAFSKLSEQSRSQLLMKASYHFLGQNDLSDLWHQRRPDFKKDRRQQLECLRGLLTLRIGGKLASLVDVDSNHLPLILQLRKKILEGDHCILPSDPDLKRLPGDGSTVAVTVALLSSTPVQKVGHLQFDALCQGSFAELDLVGKELSPIEAGIVGQFFADANNKLTELRLSQNITITPRQFDSSTINFEGRGLAKELCMIAAVLPFVPHITTLQLRNNKIGFAGYKSLSAAVAKSNVANLDVSENEMGLDGACSVAEMLSAGKLSCIFLGPKNTKLSLRSNDVKKLDLRAKEFGAAEMIVLAACVPLLPNLVNLCVESTGKVDTTVGRQSYVFDCKATSLSLANHSLGPADATLIAAVFSPIGTNSVESHCHQLGAQVVEMNLAFNPWLFGNADSAEASVHQLRACELLCAAVQHVKLRTLNLGHVRMGQKAADIFATALNNEDLTLRKSLTQLDLSRAEIGESAGHMIVQSFRDMRLSTVAIGRDISLQFGEPPSTALCYGDKELWSGELQILSYWFAQSVVLDTVTEIDLSNNRLGVEGAQAFAQLIPQSNLKTIKLGTQSEAIKLRVGAELLHLSGLHSADLILAASCIPCIGGLTELDISGHSNDFDHDGMAALARTLAECSHMKNVLLRPERKIPLHGGDDMIYDRQYLDLSGIELRSHDLLVVAVSLPLCPELIEINLSGNSLFGSAAWDEDQRGWQTFCEALGTCALSHLKRLKLADVRMGPKGLKLLTTSVLASDSIASKSIQILDLSNNPLVGEAKVIHNKVYLEAVDTHLTEWQEFCMSLPYSSITELNVGRTGIGA